jgi:hypothetical protein
LPDQPSGSLEAVDAAAEVAALLPVLAAEAAVLLVDVDVLEPPQAARLMTMAEAKASAMSFFIDVLLLIKETSGVVPESGTDSKTFLLARDMDCSSFTIYRQ